MIPDKDLHLICELRQNARNPLTNLSKIIKMPVSTIFDRLKKYSGTLITKNTCLIDFDKIGYSMRANIILDFKKEDRESAHNHLMNHFNVNSLYTINNHSFLAETVFRNMTEIENFIEELETKFTIRKKEVHYIMKEIKREAFMSDKLTADLLKI